MSNKNYTKLKYEEEVPYIVKIKEQYYQNLRGFVSKTGEFCGFLVNNNYSNFYFELKGNRMLIIIPHESIEYMYPSKSHLDKIKY